MLYAVATLLVMQLAGEWIVRAFGLPVPGALAGLLLLFAALLIMGRLPAGLRQTAGHVLPHLMFLFIPAVAGVTVHFERLEQQWLPFVLACTAGTAITVTVTAATFCWVHKRTQKE
ncbi:MAG: CidA/LrgA family protein [Pusillimonas sp.]|nr:CidA/LrgA family protein [Pusillimonas sp.]